MPGLEEKMGEVVDVRPDRFLRAMRDLGDFGKAAEQAGLTVEEAEDLCKTNHKFDLAVIDCHLEWLEDRFNEQKNAQLKAAREAHMRGHYSRHGVEVSTTPPPDA